MFLENRALAPPSSPASPRGASLSRWGSPLSTTGKASPPPAEVATETTGPPQNLAARGSGKSTACDFLLMGPPAPDPHPNPVHTSSTPHVRCKFPAGHPANFGRRSRDNTRRPKCKFVQICTNLHKFVQICANLYKFVQICILAFVCCRATAFQNLQGGRREICSGHGGSSWYGRGWGGDLGLGGPSVGSHKLSICRNLARRGFGEAPWSRLRPPRVVERLCQ